MTRMKKLAVVCLLGALVAGTVIPQFLQAATPGGAKPTATGRTPEAIMKELDGLQEQAMTVMPSLKSVADPAFRASEGKKAAPVLKKMAALLGELEGQVTGEDKESARMGRFRFMAFAGALGDQETVAALEVAAKGKGADALSAKAALTLVRWLGATGDAVGQGKILDEFAVVEKENPTSPEVAAMMMAMTELGPANNDVTKKVIESMRANLQGPAAKSMLTELDNVQEQLAMIGKPFVFEGRTSTGGKFSSSNYKGKVVMVDFWATWCGPCIQELPHVQKVYAENHAKGLEIVGISCDSEDAVLNKFIKDKDMPWVQLRESTQNDIDQWSPLAKGWHVEAIPAMFLIDRNGVLRYVDAREDLDKKVAELIKESPKSETR